MDKLKILIVTNEIDPFLKITSAADVIALLPQGLQKKGHEIRIFMPKFGVINERKNRLHEVIKLSGINIKVGNEEKPLTIKVASIPNARLQVYFLDNEDYFKRKSVFKNEDNEYFHDNDERAIFFCKGILETIKKLNWSPNIIHCHDWMASLIPLYIKTHYKDDPIFKNSKIVYTYYNHDAGNIKVSENFYEKVKLEGIPKELLEQFKKPTFDEVHQSCLSLADAIIMGDPAAKVQTNLQNGTQPAYIDYEQPNFIDSHIELYRRILN